MRADLLDVHSAVDWAVTHIPVLQERIISWHHGHPYEMTIETDPDDAERDVLVAYARVPVEPLIVGDVGAIISALRSALDMLAAVLSERNGKPPDSYTRFIIRDFIADFAGALKSAEREQRLSVSDVLKLKSLRAYKGGDKTLWPLHRLDIIRKHHRFVVAVPQIEIAELTYWPGGGIEPRWQHLHDKTIIFSWPKGHGFHPHKGNTGLTAQIIINEPAVDLYREPAIDLLRSYASSVSDIIDLFE